MSASKFVLFICTGNTCRSPMAEALFRQAISEREDYSVQSAGVAASHGCSCSYETAMIAHARGVDTAGFRSQPVSKELLENATHVFTMTSSHLAMLESQFPQYADKYFLACEFVDLPGQGIGADVPDPIGMGTAAYQEVAKTLDLAIPAIISFIDQTSES